MHAGHAQENKNQIKAKEKLESSAGELRGAETKRCLSPLAAPESQQSKKPQLRVVTEVNCQGKVLLLLQPPAQFPSSSSSHSPWLVPRCAQKGLSPSWSRRNQAAARGTASPGSKRSPGTGCRVLVLLVPRWDPAPRGARTSSGCCGCCSRLGLTSGSGPICRGRMWGRTGDTMRGSSKGRAGTGTSRSSVHGLAPGTPKNLSGARPGVSAVPEAAVPQQAQRGRRHPRAPHPHTGCSCTCLALGGDGTGLQQPVRGEPGREGAGRGGSGVRSAHTGVAAPAAGSEAPRPAGPVLLGGSSRPPRALLPGAGTPCHYAPQQLPALPGKGGGGGARAEPAWWGRGWGREDGDGRMGMGGWGWEDGDGEDGEPSPQQGRERARSLTCPGRRVLGTRVPSRPGHPVVSRPRRGLGTRGEAAGVTASSCRGRARGAAGAQCPH